MQRELPSTITNGQKLALTFHRFSKKNTTSTNYFSLRSVRIVDHHPPESALTFILGKLTVSGRVRTEYNPCFYRARRRWGQEPVCAYGMRIYIEGRKIRSGLGGDRTGGVLQVAAEKGLDSKLPRGSYCAESTRVRSIAGRRVAIVVSKFR